MRHFKLMAITGLAACAICALAAANASAALPEWGKCVKLPATIKGKEKKAGKGKFANSNCTEATTGGEFEFVKGTAGLQKEFTNTMTSTDAVLETSFGIAVTCTSETAHGDLSGTKEVSGVVVTFTGCHSNIPELACENEVTEPAGEELRLIEGEIKTRTLKGKLVYISGAGTANPSVGLELTPAEKHGWFAFFGCGPTQAHPAQAVFSAVGRKPQGANGGDAIVSPITPINTMGTETTQVYKSAAHENPETGEIEDRGVQEPSEINGKPAFLETQLFFIDETSASEWGKASQEETAVTKLTSGEELEIKA